MAADELFGPDGTEFFGPDGTQEPRPIALPHELPADALAGLVTGPAFVPGDWADASIEQDPPLAVGAPDALDQQQLRMAMDKAMMTGPPTNPISLGQVAAAASTVRPGPTVAFTPMPPTRPTPQPARPTVTRLPSSRPRTPVPPRDRSNLAGREALRKRHPVVSALIRLAVPIIFVVLVLLAHGFGGTLSGLFQ